VLVGIDAVNVMAAYQPVVQCASVGTIKVFLILLMHGASMKTVEGNFQYQE
jgi:hypothetical protein